MVVSDLDGTLLSEDSKLTETVKQSIERFRSAGGLFTIATGRFGPSVKQIVSELNIDIPYILCNGAVIADRHNVLEMAELPLQEVAPFLLEADREGCSVVLFQTDEASVFRRSEHIEQIEQQEGITCRVMNRLEEPWMKQSVLKVLVIGNVQRISDLWREISANFQLTYETVQSDDHFFEILPPGQSKGKALKKLMQLMQLSPSEVMSIGNQFNDVDMFKQAGIGVAVANSHPEVKKEASFVCRQGYGDGVVEAMERFAMVEQRN